ncbi:putative ETC complex I subunit conserved region [Lyophyllum shimeji]|uniref:NADH dehydrogenase [ubiquinone] iron-sulfur protein 4, mitochondrial n=1 Tax=Lyophyllum shimeji TaxID=47721 RepID=A0A9P3PLY0_LYOSH|nr:putative ETC complex I subunit conserved region [Lyophyllum shimeji]
MSLLQVCKLTARAQTLRAAAVQSRGVATGASKAPVVPAQKVASSDITPAPQPPRDVMVADVISGAPAELRHRSVRIYQPTRSTMQSGGAKSERWRIDFDILPFGGRWENPLIGYASSADYMQGTKMSFRTKEDAIHFAEKQGWDYYVQTPPKVRIPPKNYSENFLYRPGKLRIVRTK